MSPTPPLHAGRVAVVYAALAAAWIVFSDLLLEAGAGSAAHGSLAMAKGLLFVAVTSLFLYGLLRHVQTRVAGAEAVRRREEARWRQALEGVGDGLWEWEIRTNCVYYAPQLELMLGYAAGEFRHEVDAWQSRVHPDDLPAVSRELERCLAREVAVYQSEHRLRRKDGSWAWVLDRGVVLERDWSGRPLRMIGTHFDITPRKELEQRLGEQAEHYHMLFEKNPQPMWIYDVESGRILAVNEFAVAKYGYAREEFLRLTVHDLRPLEDGPQFAEHLAKRRPPVQSSGPWRHRRADGSVILVEVMSHAIDWRGRPARVVVAHDITAQERAVHEVAESEQKFRAIFDSANDAIFTADEHYRITSCNSRGGLLVGLAPEAVVGRFLMDFFPARQSDGSDSRQTAQRILNELGPKHADPFEWTLQRADGAAVEAEITLSGLQHGGRRSFVVVARDITERKRATRELQLLHAALQATPEGVIITDAQGRIEWANPAFSHITGYALAEVQGETPRKLRSGHHDEEFYRGMWQTILRGETWSGEVQNRRKDGGFYFEHQTIAPVRNSAGEITNFVAVKEDITNERRLEQQLARSQRLESVGMLASGIAHDLNNVLTPIVLAVELLRAEGELTAAARGRLDLVGQAAQRGASIVKQVLTFARGVEGERTIVQPRYLLKEVAQLAEETFPRSIEIHVENGKDVPTIRGDVTQLHQVLLNLAVNARDAMPQGGRLTLGARSVAVDAERARALAPFAPGNYVELTVADTGIGMTDEVLEHMFEPFFTTKPRGKGTGLGLSTVYGIVRSHGGKVEVDTQLGRGTTFRVLLPEVVDQPAPRPPTPAERALEGGGRRVLVVDDEEAIRTVLAQTLRRHGFDPVTVADGVQALQLFRLRPEAYHAAIVDLMMPRMHGAEVIRELRAIMPTLRIVYSSGFAGGDDMVAEVTELAAGEVNAFLPKPFREEELLEALRKAEAAAGAWSEKKKV
ncbi:PAS domain S-box protein [Oleiharenicola sp. Vm1]|uniref:PAS domain-containing hybrid sensor histidine kinase/response regulator n=1 Tax=Oleiharenicola sp. Vm1 TaxID=3398393 RepID=UPI0039F47BD4